jgi:hypothetical protein
MNNKNKLFFISLNYWFALHPFLQQPLTSFLLSQPEGWQWLSTEKALPVVSTKVIGGVTRVNHQNW